MVFRAQNDFLPLGSMASLIAEASTTCQEFDCLITDDVRIVRRAPYHFLPSYHSLENFKSSVTTSGSGVKSGAHLSHSRLLYSHCTMLTCTALSKVFNLRQSFLSGVHSKDLLFDRYLSPSTLARERELLVLL